MFNQAVKPKTSYIKTGACAALLSMLLVLPYSALADSETVRMEHIVGPSENLAHIAARYDVTASDIQEWNNLSSLQTATGKTLTLYVSPELAKAHEGSSTDFFRLLHKVSPGESLNDIAQTYSVSLADVITWNRIKNTQLNNGQLLRLFVSEPVYLTHRKEKPVREDIESPIAQAVAATSPEEPVTSPKIQVAEAAGDVAPTTRIVDIPEPIRNSGSFGKGVEVETILIKTEDLHGYTEEDIKMATLKKFTSLTGAAMAVQGQHVSQTGFVDYIIESGDILEFISFNDTNLSHEDVVVRYDGYISLPLIPDVKVGGRTRTEAEALIQESYSNIYREPEIALVVTDPDSKQYTVIGDISVPGRYPYTRPTTLNEAIFLAGGLRERSSAGSTGGGFIGLTGQVTQAYIIRRIDDERVVIPHDLRGLIQQGDHEGDEPVFYGDLVYVPEGVNLVYVLGETNSPRIVELTEGMTLLEMLALSGGFDTRRARMKEVILLRQENDTMSSVHKINVKDMLEKGGARLILQPGDIVYLPTKRLVKLREWVEDFTGILSPWLNLYTSAVDSVFAYDLADETLNALEAQNGISIGTRSSVPGITRFPR